MSRDHLLVLVFVICIVNGMFSQPFVLFFVLTTDAWFPSFLPRTPGIVFYVSSLLAATATLILSGIPAAITERVTRQPESTTATMLIWLASALLISLPALERFAGLLFTRTPQ